jgi:two-component system response regulator YesN
MYRYVVIDDESLIRRAIVKKIASLGLPLAWVGEAEDGEEGLDLALRESPDIVLTDMRMPAMDGISLLHALSEQKPDAALIVISGFSDFEYTREAIATNVIDYILKPFDNKELHAALEKAINFHREKENKRKSDQERELEMDRERLSAWLCRGGADEQLQSLPKQYRSATIKGLLGSNSFAVGLLTLPDSHARLFPNVKDADRTLSGSTGEYIFRLPHPERTDTALIVIGSQMEAEKKVRTMLSQTIEEVRRSGGEAVGAASRSYGKLEELRMAYREAWSLLDHRPFGLWTGLLQESGAVYKKMDGCWPCRDDLLYEIEVGHVQQALYMTGELFKYIRSLDGATLAQAKQYCVQLARDIAKVGNQEREDEMNDDDLGLITSMRQAMDPMELEHQFTELVRTISERVLALLPTAAGQIGQVKHYIDLRYSQPIRLEEVAERFYLHPVYLSMVFKESMGETFQDYLKRLRMERAKQLLSSTKYRIDRIAGMIGYDNAKYFYKVFKKEIGLTPAEYRKSQATIE